MDSGLGRVAQACRALSLPRSGYYRVKAVSQSNRRMNNRIVKLSRQHPRYGYRRITALLRREGRRINSKRVARVRRAEGLKVRKRQRRTRRLGPSQTQRLSATQRNQVWSWDFVMDQTESGGAFRILTLMDEHTRQCLARHAAWSIRAQDVLTVLEAAMSRHGTPEHIRSDNGPEFIAQEMELWAERNGIELTFIQKGRPMQNGLIERFNRTYRTEVLDAWIFESLEQVRQMTQEWMWRYNHVRPHASLLRLSPRAFLLKCGQLPSHYTGSRADFPTVQQDIHNTTTLRSTFTNHCA